MKEELNCPCCPKSCSRETLKCGKGRHYFQEETKEDHNHHESKRGHHRKRYHQEEGGTIEDDLRMLMRKCGHILWHRFGGKGSQTRILRLLGKKEITTQKELLELTEVKAGSLSELLGKMEATNLLVRSQNPTDKRTVNVQLTDMGRKEMLERHEERHQETMDMFSCLTNEEKEALFVILEKLLGNWKHKTDERGHRQKGKADS